MVSDGRGGTMVQWYEYADNPNELKGTLQAMVYFVEDVRGRVTQSSVTSDVWGQDLPNYHRYSVVTGFMGKPTARLDIDANDMAYLTDQQDDGTIRRITRWSVLHRATWASPNQMASYVEGVVGPQTIRVVPGRCETISVTAVFVDNSGATGSAGLDVEGPGDYARCTGNTGGGLQ